MKVKTSLIINSVIERKLRINIIFSIIYTEHKDMKYFLWFLTKIFIKTLECGIVSMFFLTFSFCEALATLIWLHFRKGVFLNGSLTRRLAVSFSTWNLVPATCPPQWFPIKIKGSQFLKFNLLIGAMQIICVNEIFFMIILKTFRYIKFSLMITLGPYDSGVGGQNTYVSSYYYIFSYRLKANVWNC